MRDCLGWLFLFIFLLLRYVSFWTGSNKVEKMRRHRKPLLHFTGYFDMVSSGFFLPNGVLTSQGSINILEPEHVNYRDSAIVGEERVKEEVLIWK